MKKTLVSLAKIISVSTALLLTQLANAEEVRPIEGLAPFSVSTADLKGIVLTIGQSLAMITAMVSVVLLIIAGIMYMTAAGGEEQIGKAKNIIKYSITGLIIAILAYAIVVFIVNTFLRGT